MGKIQNFYEGKTVLLTGITGFLGKVIFEKLLRTLPQIKRIYVLIRSKKGSSVNERFNKVVHDSEIFIRLREIQGSNFQNYLDQIVKPVEGDLLQENLGLSKKDREELINEVNIVINCAASVDFNAKLSDAMAINVQGTLRMMELAKQGKKVQNFVHVSTCYVNSDKVGWIEEEIYDSDQSARKLINDLLKIPLDELERNTKTILGKYPNTYVFTKSAVERIMKDEKPPNMTITIVRPSIIGATLEDPCIGWVEGVTALSAVFLLSGIGMLKHMQANTAMIGDIIPVDMVSNEVIVSGAFCANNHQINVFNCGTSSKNPMLWKFTKVACFAYWKKHTSQKSLAEVSVQLIKYQKIVRFHHIMRRIPGLALQKFAQIIGNKKLKANADRYVKLIYKSEEINASFVPFGNTEWVFDSRKIEKIIEQMEEDEKKIFNLDVSTINWYYYLLYFNWGLHRFILGEKIDRPFSEENDILSLNKYQRHKPPYFDDINWAMTSGKDFKPRSFEEYKSLVFNSPLVQQSIQQVIEERSQKQGFSTNLAKQVNKEANSMIVQMISNYQMPFIRAMAWFLHKVFKQIYEKVVIDDEQLKLLASHDVKKDGPLIMIPTHRSYIDFLLVSYIFFAYKLQAPHIAAAEDFLNVTIVHHILRASGAFFMNREQKNNPIYKAIFYEYVQRLLMDDCMLEFFVEGTRSRSGKMLHPKFGVIGIVADAVFDGKIPDAKIVPITLNYEKVLEGDTFPYELLGEQKVKESLPRLIKAVKTLNMNFGRINVNICKPISIKDYLNEHHGSVDIYDRETRKNIICDISYQVEYQLTSKLVCMSTAMVASLMLCSRKGITEDNLIANVYWLAQRITERGGLIQFNCDLSGSAIANKSAVNLLEGILIKSKKNIFELEVTSDTQYKNILMLHYYSNGLLHVFILEAIVCVTLISFGQVAFTEGVSLERIWEESQFLLDLLEREYVVPNVPNNIEAFKQTLLSRMIEFGVVRVDSNNKILAVDEKQISYCCSLVWPFVETYWSVSVYMQTLAEAKSKTLSLEKFLCQSQYFTENMHDERVITHHESCSLDIIKNAIHKYKTLNISRVFKEGKEDFIQLIAPEQKLIELECHIQKFVKKSLSSSVSVSELAKRTLLQDFPILARL